MKPFLSKVLVVGCLMAVVGFAWAVADGQEGKKKKGKADATAQIKKKIADAELPADVREKAEKIVAEHAAKINEAQAKVNEVLTREQRQALNDAQKAAKQAGKKAKAAREEALASLKLTDDQKTKLAAAERELQAAQQALNRDLRSVLNEEQQAKVIGKGKKKKGNN